MKEATMICSLETWRELALDSSHGNHLLAQKLKFLSHLQDNPSTFSIWKGALRFWLNSSNNIPTEPKSFREPVKAHMVNAEYGKEFHLPKDGSSSSSPGQILPDLCSSPTSKLFHATKMDSKVPPHLQPQYSKKHPQVAAKNRDSLREISTEANKS